MLDHITLHSPHLAFISLTLEDGRLSKLFQTRVNHFTCPAQWLYHWDSNPPKSMGFDALAYRPLQQHVRWTRWIFNCRAFFEFPSTYPRLTLLLNRPTYFLGFAWVRRTIKRHSKRICMVTDRSAIVKASIFQIPTQCDYNITASWVVMINKTSNYQE